MSMLYGDLTIAAFDVDLVNSSSYDYIFLAVSGSFSLEWAEKLTNGGKTVVIDNSSAFRYHDSIPLVVPEINLAAIGPDDKLIANPNCTTAIAAMALHPIHAKYVRRSGAAGERKTGSDGGGERRGRKRARDAHPIHLPGTPSRRSSCPPTRPRAAPGSPACRSSWRAPGSSSRTWPRPPSPPR
jgi:N-acetyl-gamma-glutamylphosphate reductase